MDIKQYQQETNAICLKYESLLKHVVEKMKEEQPLWALEEEGVIHSLQILVENAIGKAKVLLKYHQQAVPQSAYDSFASLHHLGMIQKEDAELWKKIIGLRNNIVHEYMQVNLAVIYQIVENQDYVFILKFLRKPFNEFPAPQK